MSLKQVNSILRTTEQFSIQSYIPGRMQDGHQVYRFGKGMQDAHLQVSYPSLFPVQFTKLGHSFALTYHSLLRDFVQIDC